MFPALVSMRQTQCAGVVQAPQTLAGCWIPDVTGSPLGTTDISLDRNKDLKKPHLTGPSTGEKEWALVAIWRETQRQPHLDSKVWADGCHPFFSSTSCQDPPSGPPSLARLMVFPPENVGKLFQDAGWRLETMPTMPS